MSIRSQIACLLIMLSVVFVATTWAVQAFVMMPAFVEIEHDAARRNVGRCFDAILGDLENLSNLTNDWASWDDTYQFGMDGNEQYRKTNLIPETFTNTNTNLLCIVNADNRIVWGDCRDSVTREKIAVPEVFEMLESGRSGLTGHTDVNDGSRKGIVLTQHGPMLIVSRPLITTKRTGPIRGAVVMGRFVSSTYVSDLSAKTHTDLNIWHLASPELPGAALPIVRDLVRGTMPPDSIPENAEHVENPEELGDRRVIIRPSDSDRSQLQAYALMHDFFGKPALLLRVQLSRRITMQGHSAARAATVCSLLSGFFTILGMGLVLQKRIVGPLQQMVSHAVNIGRTENLKARLGFCRKDEIGTLARTFDDMVASLDTALRKVEENAHRAGMAEIASEVLHNVGNAVNSTSCSTELIEERLRDSRLPGLDRATRLLSDQSGNLTEFFRDDPRGQRLIDYLSNLNQTLQQERRDNLDEVTRLHETIRHIRDAIAEQQTMAGGVYCRQEIELGDLIQESIRLNHNDLQRHRIEVILRKDFSPMLHLNGNKMTQVLMNLIRNAILAMREIPHDHRKLTIATQPITDGGVEITVADTGCGIPSEVLGRLFTHGFTTRTNGHGFGLHFCANTVQAHGGSISVQSDGEGQGATFRICLPSSVVLGETVS